MRTYKASILITTDRLAEVKEFYTKCLGFEVVFEMANEHLALRRDGAEISFMRPERGQQPFAGHGITVCLLVDDVDAEHERLVGRAKLPAVRPLQDNPWGDRSFVIVDPIGTALYIHKEIVMDPGFRQYLKK